MPVALPSWFRRTKGKLASGELLPDASLIPVIDQVAAAGMDGLIAYLPAQALPALVVARCVELGARRPARNPEPRTQRARAEDAFEPAPGRTPTTSNARYSLGSIDRPARPQE